MSTAATDQRPSRKELATDLSALLTLPPGTLASLRPSSDSTHTDTAKSALSTLDTFTPSTSDHKASQELIKAYIRDMRGNVLKMDRGEGDRLGARIDVVREKAEGIKAALGKVKM